MNDEILSKEVQVFINENLNSDTHKILLKKSPFPKVSTKELVIQIESKNKSIHKLPTWFATENIYYPKKRNLSQSSSEVTAGYKASLVRGDTLVDVTAGFGVDCVAFSGTMKEVTYVDSNKTLSEIAKHNFKQLGISSIGVHSGDGIAFLQGTDACFDWIYLDPSRRDSEHKKVYFLSDCEPDMTAHSALLFSKSNNILVKTGPLLDLSQGLKQLDHVKEIHIVAVSNDVKEVLWLLEKNFIQEPYIKTVNFTKNILERFNFYRSEEDENVSTFSLPQDYLYEPNAAILKAGAFKSLGLTHHLDKLHIHSHLYTSTEHITFPGRVFKIVHSVPYSNRAFKKLSITKANVTTRNFPDSVTMVRKKLDLKDGGELYVFCTTDLNEKLVLLVCTQIFEDSY
ncbi:MAG: class I SAM-dependent methyltransferase [Maribacter sp.]